MATATRKTDAMEARITASILKALTAANGLKMSTKTTAPKTGKTSKASASKASKSAAFIAWMHETAEARAERKGTNRELASAMRAAGLEPNGDAWTAAKVVVANGGTTAKAVKAAQA